MAARLRIPLAILIAAAAPAALAADGLLLERQMVWPRWQPRLSLYDAPDIAPLQRAALVGDYDLGSFGLSLPFASGRFRATSGLIFDLRNKPGLGAPMWAALAAGDAAPLSAPYIGLGYTGWVPKTGLSFSADLGLSLPFASGRFRATSGLIFDLRNRSGSAAPAWAAFTGDATPLSAPYIGLGYTGWVPKTGLSFSADLGLSADYPGGAWRFGRALFGNQGFDATLRDLRLQPRLQLGVQYTY